MNLESSFEQPTYEFLILAGGQSKRMNEPKHAVTLHDGRPMIEHVVDVCREFIFPINISCSTEPDEVLRSLKLPLIVDDEKFEGPLYAIANGLEKTEADNLIVVCCDQPHLEKKIIDLLLKDYPDGYLKVFCSEDDDSIYPFPGIYPKSELGSMKDALNNGERSPRRWLKDCEFLKVILNDKLKELIRSINSKHDLEKLRNLKEC